MRLRLAALALLLASTPACAWDYEERQDGGRTVAGAWQDGESGYQLAVECDDAYTDPDLYLFTPEIFVGQHSDGVPLMFSVDGIFIGPLFSATENSGGHLAIAVRSWEEDRLGPLLYRLLRARQDIVVSYRATRLSFGTEDVLVSMSRLLDACGRLAAGH